MNDNDVSRFVTFDPEEIVTREVFARFGRAFYCANVLERGVLMALVRAEWRRNLRPPMTREEYQTQYDAFYGKWEKKSLGQVVERLFLQPDITDELRRLLVKAVSARNTLAHHYFWLRSGDFDIHDGRMAMINECDDFLNCFEEATVATDEWQNNIGDHALPEEILEEALRQITIETQAKYGIE